MKTLTPTDNWRRWSVTALGALLCGVIVSTVAITHIEWTMVHHLQFAIPILLALGLTAYGGWIARSELPTERISRIAIWSLAGIVVIGSFATWETYLHLIEGEPFIATLHELLLGGTHGAIVGGLVGYYDAQRREQHQETKRVQRAISASIDGIAILDENGRYTSVNQAHADAYGYEGPEDFLGESWRMCYTDDKVAEFEEQIFPTLETDGEWRGEAIGQQRDGSSFPQELTLTALDDGGLVCIVRDISERRAQEQELERKTDLLEKTQRMATVGGWELDRVRETYPEVMFETTIPDSVTVQANELLGEILGNVVTNAVHHNNSEGLRISITVSEGQEGDTVVVRIADNGKGVPDEYKETIFRRDATGHAKSSGSGFGLFFVDSMVDQYGGDVWVEDNERGGATFVIELPLAEATAPI